MKQYKECQICKTNIGKHTCQICGALVCNNCYEKGMCIKCRQGKQ